MRKAKVYDDESNYGIGWKLVDKLQIKYYEDKFTKKKAFKARPIHRSHRSFIHDTFGEKRNEKRKKNHDYIY